MARTTVVLIEPCVSGLGFLYAAAASQYEIIAVVSSQANPRLFGYSDIPVTTLVADVRKPKDIIATLEQFRRKKKFHAIIPGNDYVTHITAIVAGYFGSRGIPATVALRARLKDRARMAYEKAGLPNPRFVKIRATEEASHQAALIGYPLVVKPTDCAGSQKVTLATNEKELKRILEDLKTFDRTYLDFVPSGDFLLEEFVEGPEFSVEMLLVRGTCVFAAVTEKLVSLPPHFIELGHVVPTSVFAEKSEEMIWLARRALLALGIEDGVAHVELKHGKEGFVLIETNARPAGGKICTHLLKFAFGVDVYGACLEHYLRRRVFVTNKRRGSAAITFLTSNRRGMLRSIEVPDDLLSLPNIKKVEIWATEGIEVRPPEDGDDRLGCVIVVGSEPAVTKKVALSCMERIHVEVD